MLLNSGDDAGRVVSEGVNVKLGRLLQEFINQDWTIMREINGRPHVFVETSLVINNRHRASAQDIAGAHQDGITNSLSDQASLFNRCRRAVFRLRNSQVIKQ